MSVDHKKELRNEALYLRSLLTNAHEEKNAELAVVHDDIATCHHIIRELRTEVECSRTMLALAHREKIIELTIAHGEIVEHRRISQELGQQCNELESQLQDARSG